MAVHTLICFGEVLWDLLPTGKIAGGAPMNVAYHANNFGLQSKMISKVGSDELGKELLSFLDKKGVATDLIQVDDTFPTGIAKVKLDENHSATYELVQPVAWDYINLDPKAEMATQQADAMVFGSLACRTERTKKTLLSLLALARLKIFDVNLRPPFFSRELLEELLPYADVLKMNEEELEIIAGWYTESSNEAEKLQSLCKKFDLQTLIVTKGAEGVLLLHEGRQYAQHGFPIEVEDTVGSGDSFLAAFISKLLAGYVPQECLQFASATGALVATKKGGTPEIDEQMVLDFIKSSQEKSTN